MPKRADARDALCARTGLDLDGLPAGARVGTGSPAAARSCSPAAPISTWSDSRQCRHPPGRVGSDDLDAVVLAAAGLGRLGRLDAATELLGLDGWPTAPAQGALAIETRTADAASVAQLDHRPSRLTATAERGVLARLEAGCSAPVGAHAILDDGLLFLSARVYATDGSAQLTSSHALYPEDVRDPAVDLAERVADELLKLGAADLVDEARG